MRLRKIGNRGDKISYLCIKILFKIYDYLGLDILVNISKKCAEKFNLHKYETLPPLFPM